MASHHITSRRSDFERISLNAMEERVLPPDVRIKIVCAQATAVEQEEELLEADVSITLGGSNDIEPACGENLKTSLSVHAAP